MSCEERRGDWIQTFTGIEFYPLDPKPEEILIEDIAHALSMQCRYAGHVREFYSVAEHSVRVAEIVPPKYRLWGLLHDASEAYLIDLPRPVKRYSDIGRLYREAEDSLMIAICERFGLTWEDPMPAPVERADKAMLWVESQALLPSHPCWAEWRALTDGTERTIESTLGPAEAEGAFLSLFRGLKLHRALRLK